MVHLWTNNDAMKNVLKSICCVFILSVITNSVSAQNELAAITPKATAIVENPSAPAPNTNKEVTILLRNASEKSVAVFAGPKEELKEPKLKVVGGLSKNNLYLKENDAVCLMTVDKRPMACTIVKPGVTTVEVNVSANAISSK